QRIFVGVHEHQVVAPRALEGVTPGLVQAFALEQHLGAVHARVLDLGVGRAPRHHDHRRNAEARSMVGDRLGVVARAHRDHAAAALRGVERQQLVERAAFLERGGELQIFELEEDFGSAEAGERAAVDERRVLDRARHARRRGQALARAERDGRFQAEGWRLRKDGSQFWADVVITALRDPAGRLRGFAKVTRDMTARQREREQEYLLAAMFERAPTGIALADRGGRYVRTNAAFQRLLGYSETELRGKTIGEL